MSQRLDLTFATPDPITLHVENGRGSVQVHATETAETVVEITGDRAEEFDVRDLGDRISVVAPPRSGGFLSREPHHDVRVQVPATSGLRAVLGSSDLTVRGRLGDAEVESGSGDVSLDVVDGRSRVRTGSGDVVATHLVGDSQLRTGSGDLRVGAASAHLVISTGSGDVVVDAAGDELAVKTGAGDAEVRAIDGEAVFTTGSGDLVVGEATGGRITAKTGSGDLRIGVAPGTPVWTDVRTSSGRLTSTLPSTGEPEPGQHYLELRATTASGDVALHPSTGPA